MSSESFETFVQETGPRLYRAALLLTGDHHQAEDLTQATYAKVFVAWRRLGRAEHPVAYAHRTLHNTFLSQRRRRSSRELPSDELPELPEAAGSDEPDHRLDLMAALALLTPTDRAVLVARYWEDHSVAETARLLGITETAVRTRARRALQRIRPHLTETIRSTR